MYGAFPVRSSLMYAVYELHVQWILLLWLATGPHFNSALSQTCSCFCTTACHGIRDRLKLMMYPVLESPFAGEVSGRPAREPNLTNHGRMESQVSYLDNHGLALNQFI